MEPRSHDGPGSQLCTPQSAIQTLAPELLNKSSIGGAQAGRQAGRAGFGYQGSLWSCFVFASVAILNLCDIRNHHDDNVVYCYCRFFICIFPTAV